MKLRKEIRFNIMLEWEYFQKMLLEHFKYSIKNINSYEELTSEEKEIIPDWLFEVITEENNGDDSNIHKDNLAIIRRLAEIIDNYPKLRFQQILYIFNIVENGEDKFYEESSKTLSNLNKNILNYNKNK